jgi:hypothetical protein
MTTVLSDRRLAALLLEAGFPHNSRVIAEGIGVIHAESGGNPSEASQGPGGHIGLWAEEPSFGSVADRLDPLRSTQAAFRQWKKDGSFEPAWGQYESGETEGTGPSRFRQYLSVAEAAIAGGGRAIAGGRITPPRATGQAAAPGGLSGPMRFLVTAVLVLGGIGLLGLGLMRSVGQAAPVTAAAV